MRIKNELTKIKVGNKNYDLYNLILDEYLKRFATFQMDKDNINLIQPDRRLRYCLLKFDEPIDNISEDMDIHNQDFDICLMNSKYNQSISDNQIIVQYDYETDFIWDYNRRTSENVNISDYYGKKITAIGFNSWFANDEHTVYTIPICAILDTSNYNIYLQENQELSITRKDIISSDALFYSNNKERLSGPIHLCPYGISNLIQEPLIYSEDRTGCKDFNKVDRGHGFLYSIGLSSYPDYIDKEFVIGQDIQAIQNDNEITISGLKNYLSIEDPVISNSNLIASNDLYPIKTNYKYIIFKYKVWQDVHSGTYDDVIVTTTDTGYYYYQAIPINKYGKSNLKIKYERG